MATRKAFHMDKREKADLLEGINKVIDLHEAYFEACAWLIEAHPELIHIIRDGRAYVNEERRKYMRKQEEAEWAND